MTEDELDEWIAYYNAGNELEDDIMIKLFASLKYYLNRENVK
jgi:hypothetical protein